jgi:phosphonate transport system substrate-binding protein
MTLSRRAIVAAALLAATPVCALAQDWRKDHPSVTMSVISAENQADLLARNKPVADYMTKALGVPFKVVTASDYAGTIEAMKSKKVDMAYFGPASYAKAYEVTGGNVEAFAVQLDQNGNAKYNSVVVVKADSPYKRVEDLKGKTLAFADPNSTSGFQAPNYFLRKQGVVPEQFFAKTGFGGNHENSVLAVVQGTYDAAATWYNNEELSNFKRMEGKGMIPKDSVRVIWKSPDLPESPYVVLKSLPEAMKADIKQAFMAMPTADAAAWKALTDGKSKGLAPASHDLYLEVINLIKENERLRRTQS